MRRMLLIGAFAVVAANGLLERDIRAAPSAKEADRPEKQPGDELRLTGRVVDMAGVLSRDERSSLETKLADYEQRTRHQFVVVTTRSLGGTPIELYSLRLMKRWGIGRAGHNDGIGLLVAPTERQVRIEVGLGLERTLPDEVAARIVRETSLPRFRQGALAAGIIESAAAIITALDCAEAKNCP